MMWPSVCYSMLFSEEERAEIVDRYFDNYVEAGELHLIPRCRIFSEQAYLTTGEDWEVKYE